MRDFLPISPLSGRPRRAGSGRQIRERRTAQVLAVFGVILACVELYVIFNWV